MFSADDNAKGSFHLSRGTLTTHKEESEDDSTQQMYDNELDKASGKWHRQDVTSTSSQHKNLVLVIIMISTPEFVKSLKFSFLRIVYNFMHEHFGC